MAIKRKTRVGTVVSNKMDKTVVVAVQSVKHHALYGKTLRKVVKYKVHDEKKECREGNTVRIEETRPLSKEKRWRVAEILSKKAAVEVKPSEIS